MWRHAQYRTKGGPQHLEGNDTVQRRERPSIETTLLLLIRVVVAVVAPAFERPPHTVVLDVWAVDVLLLEQQSQHYR